MIKVDIVRQDIIQLEVMMMSTELLEAIARLEQKVDALTEQLQQASPKAESLPLSEAYKVLGYRSRQQCYKLIGELYRVGIEVEDRRKADSKYSRYYFDIEACKQRHKERPEKRAS